MHRDTQAFGTVYLMQNPHNRQRYAVKELNNLTNDDGSTNAEAMHGLIDEVRKMGVVSSPFVVRYHTSAVFEGRFYIVMEHIDGAEFRDVVLARRAQGAQFTDAVIVSWVEQLAKGLAHLHDECKLVHQDLHNGNVMIAGVAKINGALVVNDACLRGTSVKILDLGLAAFKSDKAHRTATCTMRTSTMRTMRLQATSKTRCSSFIQVDTNDVGGFKAIRAPEMHPSVGEEIGCSDGLRGMVHFDSKVDVWALGILLIEAALMQPIEEQANRIFSASCCLPSDVSYVYSQ